jgi:hypothetical protein
MGSNPIWDMDYIRVLTTSKIVTKCPKKRLLVSEKLLTTTGYRANSVKRRRNRRNLGLKIKIN